MDNVFRDKVINAFGKRVISLLYYGSNAFPEKSRSLFSDYDFCLVLDAYSPNDMRTLRHLAARFQGIDLTLHYLSDLESIGWSRFQHGNHGTFFLLHLAAAKTIIGTNIFERKLSVLEKADIAESIRRQIIEYFWRLDHWYLSEVDEETLTTKYKKYLIRIAQDILVAKGDISFSEINISGFESFVSKFILDKPYFSLRTRKYFKKILTPKANLQDYIYLREALYRDFRSILIP